MISRAARIASYAGPIIVMLALGVLFAFVLHQQDVSSQERGRQQEEIAALQAAVDEANSRLEGTGEEPVDVPDRGEVVAVGPTQAEIRGAVAAYCADGKCRGSDGAEGDAPSEAQVVSAVQRYCAGGKCAGAAGRPGADGKPGGSGVDGTDGEDGVNGVDGAPGRAPTAEEIALAVSNYCTNDACRGPAGEPGANSQVPGPPGPQGEPGPTCPEGSVATSYWVQTRTDPLIPTTQAWKQATLCVPQEG